MRRPRSSRIALRLAATVLLPEPERPVNQIVPCGAARRGSASGLPVPGRSRSCHGRRDGASGGGDRHPQLDARRIIPAPTVAFEDSSTRMKLPVPRFERYSSKKSGTVVRMLIRPMSFSPSSLSPGPGGGC